jgi:Kef-type K+ transport system membrane component KefB
MDEFSNITLIVSVALIVLLSPFFAKILRLPTTPIEIILGSIFGFLGFIHNEEIFKVLSEFGFLYLMFIAGTEINLKKFIKTPKTILKRVFFYLIILYAFSFAFSLYFNLGKIFMVLLPLISVGLVATLTKEYGKTPWLDISMVSGSFGEVASIVILTLTSAALQSGFGIEFLKTVLSLIAFLIFMYIIFKSMTILFWWFPKLSVILMPHKDNQEQDIRLSMAIFFLLVAAMMYLHLELAFGAFLAGIFIPTFFEHKHDLEAKLSSYGFGFLIPIFFIHIGYSFDLNALSLQGLISTAFTIAILMITMRVIASLVFIKKIGFIDSILLGLSHSMPLTLLIAMATLAYMANSIDKLHYYAFILAALFQVLIVMISIKLIILYKKRYNTQMQQE